MVAALLLAVSGWAGLALLVNLSLPTVGPRWLFFFLWTLALTGSALPFIWLLHRRFAPDDPAPPSVLLRQGLWVGLYGGIVAWLQVNRSLTPALAILLGIGLAALEGLVRLVERTSWRPGR